MPVLAHNDFHESEQGYRLLFDSNPHAMWIYDRESLEFLAVNDAAVHHYGYSREEFLAMTLKDIRPPEDIPSLLEKVSLVRPGMNSASGRHLKKDGAVIDVEIVSHTIRFGGKRAELVLSMDLSNREKPKPEANQLVRDTRDTHGPSSLFADDQLTEAEKRVARCVARGFNNKQIAAELGLSVKTSENHITPILAKKSFINRVELALHVFERDAAHWLPTNRDKS